MCQQHPQFLTAYRLHMHRTIKPRPHHLRYAARIVAVRLVDLRLQHRLHVPRLNADHRQARFGENAVKPLRQRPSFQPNTLEAIDGVRQNLQESFRLTRHPRFPHGLARIIHDADARLLDRHIESSKIVHAALLLLMLEAAYANLVTISLKRSTLIFSYPQAGRPITPSFGANRTLSRHRRMTECDPQLVIRKHSLDLPIGLSHRLGDGTWYHSPLHK